jgi:hypothetical protein
MSSRHTLVKAYNVTNGSNCLADSKEEPKPPYEPAIIQPNMIAKIGSGAVKD